jgi:CTP:molybdopterin cytidylyltransferase MocA
VTEPAGGIASIVLAAGTSARMGQPKLCLPFGAGTILSSAIAPHLEAGLRRVIVVLGGHADELRAAAGPADPRVSLIVNESWTEGMASSIRRGLEECADAAAVLHALGDQVGVDAARLKRLLAAWAPGVPLVVPVDGGRASHPVLFARVLFDELRALGAPDEQRGALGERIVTRRWRLGAIVVEARAIDLGPTGIEVSESIQRR